MAFLAEQKNEWLYDVMRYPAQKVREEIRILRLRSQGRSIREAKEAERKEYERQLEVERNAIDSIRNWNSR